jgi:hypothetical protein
MRPSALTDCAASVLEADPRLCRPLGLRGADAVGRAALLPVLAVAAGEWTPPQREALGAGTVGLVVLDGLLSDGAALLGPGDVLEPWGDGGAWRAGMPARLAVLGAAFAAALESWPDVAALSALPRRPALRLPATPGEALQERVLGLLWRIAARWALPAAGGVALPATLDAAALGRLLDLPVAQACAAADALCADGVLVRRRGGGWLLPRPGRSGDGPHEQRDRLRARVAEQCARSRAAVDDTLALTAQLGATYARRRSP